MEVVDIQSHRLNTTNTHVNFNFQIYGKEKDFVRLSSQSVFAKDELSW